MGPKIVGCNMRSSVVKAAPEKENSGGNITVDSELSPSSENPVQNKVITQALNDVGDNIENTITDWLEENITQETGYVLDDTLTVSGAAADAKEAGDAIGKVKGAVNQILNNENPTVDYALENGGINASGNLFGESSGTYMRFTDYYATADAVDMVFNEKGGVLGEYLLFAIYYDANKVFVLRDTTDTSYQIKTEYAYFKLSYYNRNGNDEARYRTWITWDATNKIVDKFDEIDEEIEALKGGNTFSKTDNVITIGTNKAQYLFQRVTNADINIDTWRLYKGDLKTPTGLFNMWLNSDAEGVIKLVGEDDFIGGFHGDEIMTKINVVVDGKELNLSLNYNETAFSVMSVYVESDIYHCNTSASASTKAFKRNKLLVFCEDKVSISNKFMAVDNVSVQQAALAFFQCYRDDNDDNEILHNYSVGEDYKLYDISDTSNYPANSIYMKSATYCTEYGDIFVNVKEVDPRFDNHYIGYVSIGTLTSQNRLKIYFDTIKNTVGGISITNGESIFGSFEWEIV